ncbi:MAG: GNAT family N-acetyltransferase [Candidatus Hermodarchaeota archaeon]
MLSNIYIRNLFENDSEKIVDLIKKVYGKFYFEEIYYDTHYIQKKIREKHTYWKGAFLNDKLIGQMLFTLSHDAGYLKLTMADPEFQGKGIISKMGLEMMKVKKNMNSSIFKCVYAIITENNVPMVKILKKFNFKYLGRIPYHENNKGLIIFGLVLYDLNWKIIRPHLKLGPSVYESIQSAGIKRIMSSSNLNDNSNFHINHKIEIFRSKKKYNGTNTIQICNTNKECIAELIENQHQKCWYDFKLLRNNIDLASKKKLINRILQEYSHNKHINAISFPIHVDDVVSQNMLINLGAKYYAYLPFYFKDYDSILLGFSKIEK